jgi:peptidoglycan hydrolase-like protein with peptidoglycan-binding domain
MKNKYVKIAVFTALGLGALYGGYMIYNSIKRKNEGGSDEEEVIISINENKPVSEPKFDGDKIVSIGSRAGEVKTIQTAVNNIIVDAYKSKDKGFEGDKESRRKAVANIPKLKVDGIFGSKTEGAISIIMGKKSLSYNEIKQKRIDWANAYGLPNPYKK